MTTEAVAGRASWLVGVSDWLAEVLASERERLALWLPVAFGTGVGLYFHLQHEPSLWLAPVAAALGVAIAVGLRQHLVGTVVSVAFLVAAIGFTTVQWRAHAVSAPVIERRLGPVEIEARVVAIEMRVEGRRLLLDRLRIDGLEPARTPDHVRDRKSVV